MRDEHEQARVSDSRVCLPLKWLVSFVLIFKFCIYNAFSRTWNFRDSEGLAILICM